MVKSTFRPAISEFTPNILWIEVKSTFPHFPNYAIYFHCQITSHNGFPFPPWNFGLYTLCTRTCDDKHPLTFPNMCGDLQWQAPIHISKLMRYTPTSNQATSHDGPFKDMPNSPLPPATSHFTPRLIGLTVRCTCQHLQPYVSNYSDKHLPIIPKLCDIIPMKVNFTQWAF